MSDREWYTVEMAGGGQMVINVNGADPTEAVNKEEAVTAARRLAPDAPQTLTVVKYTRREVRTFVRQVTVSEADVPA